MPIWRFSRDEPGLCFRLEANVPSEALRLGAMRGWLGEPKKPGFDAVNILLPPEQMAALLDWSSVASIAEAEVVAREGAKLYELAKSSRARHAANIFSFWRTPTPSRMEKALMATLLAAKTIKEELGLGLVPSGPQADRFARLCEQAGPIVSPGGMAALRREMDGVGMQERWRLMDRQRACFCVLKEIEALASQALGCASKINAYRLFGSENGPTARSFDCPVELARAIAAKKMELREGAIFNRLVAPDGDIKGSENIELWARDCLILAEAIELSDAAQSPRAFQARRSL